MSETMIQLMTGWEWAINAARKTVNKAPLKNPKPSKKFKLGCLYAEHSPIRTVKYWIDMNAIKRWVSGHFVRHKTGVEHFIGTCRTDRTGVNRDKLPQDEDTNHSMDPNASTIIFISRKRLCNLASKETREEWTKVLQELEKIDPELTSVCVPECVYRGFCPEIETCKYEKTSNFILERNRYVSQCRLNREKK